jgi:hypothetical protein
MTMLDLFGVVDDPVTEAARMLAQHDLFVVPGAVMREGEDINECDDDERCDIIADTFAYAIDDEKYPKQWQIGKDGQPCCTAFVPLGDPIPPPRDDLTVDMFGVKP